MNKQTSHKITICMGSSCFAHGNQIILEQVQKFLAENKFDSEVELTGSLCQGRCKDGPTMMIDGKVFTRLNTEKALKVLKDAFTSAGKNNE